MLGMITILIESEKKMSNYYLFVAFLTIMYAKYNIQETVNYGYAYML